jgi:SAM-dependent methyltransferase
MQRPFRTAAPYYARYRPAYPAALIAQLVRATGVKRDSRVLDLGSGPGSLAIPIAGYAGEVVAVDAEPAMVAELHAAAPPNVTAVNARAEDVDATWGRFQLTTAGRAFHWFDAPLVLERLAEITHLVALVADDTHDSEAQTRTLEIAAELIEGPAIRRPKFRYTDILAASVFSDVETLSVEAERTWTPDELIGMAYSTSQASPERLGTNRQEFERRVRQELEPHYRERIAMDAVIGRKPGHQHP